MQRLHHLKKGLTGSSLLILVLCWLTAVLGNNNQIVCLEKHGNQTRAHLQSTPCPASDFTVSPAAPVTQPSLSSSFTPDHRCPNCIDSRLTFTKQKSITPFKSLPVNQKPPAHDMAWLPAAHRLVPAVTSAPNTFMPHPSKHLASIRSVLLIC